MPLSRLGGGLAGLAGLAGLVKPGGLC